MNRRNFHFYSDTNPHYLRDINRQNRWSLNVWGGILGTRIVGPFFFEEHLRGDTFRNFLENDLEDLLEDVPLQTRASMWLQLDGAPAHYCLPVRQWLNINYPGKWLGRGGPGRWPARSPDLTPMDFFLWGHVKDRVYKNKPTTVQDMKDRITACFREITPEMMLRAHRSFRDRINLCRENYGAHFEQLL